MKIDDRQVAARNNGSAHRHLVSWGSSVARSTSGFEDGVRWRLDPALSASVYRSWRKYVVGGSTNRVPECGLRNFSLAGLDQLAEP